MNKPSHEDLLDFARLVAATGYDGRECSHEEGCHPCDPCGLCSEHRWDACPLGPCCRDWSVSNDEEHDSLVGIVTAARRLLGEDA